MSKVPFTQAGITDLQDALYALPDLELFEQADAVHQDFTGWVEDHIDLSGAQSDYLNAIDPLFTSYLGAKTAIAFRNRLTLQVDIPSSGDEGKWFLDKDPINPTWKNGSITASGTLTFQLGYDS